ncbi:hypothetical protein [Dyadobacter sp. CY312]|uniref:hypothetical protein n=1 Tax=Dyadobacter sp. CY312 TaxID=2907303 RepID=UPI001F3B8FB7|nr:hypothetical protein [Dyadobacter sp. CY312]MCE7038980.1 hypothetical protein [Dyadobacter sp. CY312]
MANLPYGSISDLRSFPDLTITAFQVTTADKSGLFIHDPLSTAVDDGVITVKQGTRVFTREISADINIKWWDVKGDGVSDDTTEFRKALTFWAGNGGNLIIPPGLFLIKLIGSEGNYISVNTNIKSLSISGLGGQLKTKKSFAAFAIKGHENCDLVIKELNVLGSRDSEEDDYDHILKNIYVPYNARTYNNSYGMLVTSFKNVTIDNSSVQKLHGRAVSLSNCSSVMVRNSQIIDISRSGIETNDTVGSLSVLGCRIVDIGVFRNSFNVYSDGVWNNYQFDDDPSGRVWYTDVGDCIYSNSPILFVSDNYLRNFNRMGIVADPAGLNVKTYLLAESNIFETDSLRLRCSNPQSSIWIENAQTGLITNNTIRYINRAVSEALHGYAIVTAVTLKENCSFVIENNKIYSENYNKSQLAGIKTINNSGSVIVRGNEITGKYYANIYHSNVTNIGEGQSVGVRLLEKLVVENNTCKNTNINGSCFVFDNTSTNGIHLQRLYLTGNIFSQVTKSNVTVYPYATLLNYIKDNDLDGTSVDIRSAPYPQNNFYFIGNINVGAMLPKVGVAGENNFMYINENVFVSDLIASYLTGITRLSGEIKNNRINGMLYIRSCSNLTITGNSMKSIVFDNDAQSSGFIDIKDNNIRVSENSTGIAFKNSNQFTYNNVTIVGNTIAAESSLITNATGIAFTTNLGGKINLFIEANSFPYITTLEVNTDRLLPKKKIVAFNPPNVPANSTVITPMVFADVAFGQTIAVAFAADLGGLLPLTAYVTSPGNINIVLTNRTGTAVDLTSANIFLTAI